MRAVFAREKLRGGTFGRSLRDGWGRNACFGWERCALRPKVRDGAEKCFAGRRVSTSTGRISASRSRSHCVNDECITAGLISIEEDIGMKISLLTKQ